MLEPTDRALEEQPIPDSIREDGGVVKAAAILAAGNVVSRMLGLVRETVKANAFGASGLLAAYEIAAYIPISLFDLIIGGMVNSSLVPVFSDYASKERRDELWRVLSMVLSAATLLLLLVVGVVELFTPQIAWLIGARNFTDPELTAVSIRLMRLATPAVLFMSLASILSGALYALKRFAVPAFIGAVLNGAIVVAALLRPDHVESLVWGLLIGSFLQIVLQLPALRDARLRWQLNLRHPAIRRILKLYAPIVAGLVITQISIALSYNLATRTGDDSVAYMRYATTLFQFPLGLVVTALSVAILPTLSRQAENRLGDFKHTLSDGLRLVITLILPATAGLYALALPIVALLFERGEFTPANTLITARVLQFYLLGLPFAAIDQMLVFASYARKDTLRPALVGVVAIVVYLGTAVALIRPLGLYSLMVADAVKHIVHTLIMAWLLNRSLRGLRGYGIATAAVKSLGAALVTGLAAYGAMTLLLPRLPMTSLLNHIVLVLAGGLAGLAGYTVMVFALDIQIAKALPSLLRRRS
ncbi:MAG: murein biosynthesis integral membrane protein MurJ [Chloroflexi bacterium]|nr:murein biosynthesis integral membrane protein MurJ [Chloroflexota bacterium]